MSFAATQATTLILYPHYVTKYSFLLLEVPKLEDAILFHIPNDLLQGHKVAYSFAIIGP
jgi:hypothetical protein